MERNSVTDSAAESITRMRECIVYLDRVMCGVSTDRELAIFRAHRAGADPAEIARWICVDPDSVRRTIAALEREDDIDEWGEPGHWVCLNRPC